MLKSGTVTSTALIEECLRQIELHDAELNAFITVMAETARQDARLADKEISSGRYRGPLHGIPISIKDLFDVQGVPTTAASRVRAGHVAQTDAPVVAKLREAGAILIGKSNLHEFAFGTTGENSAFGLTRNPHDRGRSPGGSSSGSAASVAAGSSFASIGTDTGGSIRIPAAACGVVGFKPSFGDLSCSGVVPLSRSLDHVGPITRCVNDAWFLYRTMRGEIYPRTLDLSGNNNMCGLKLGLPVTYFLDYLDPGVRRKFNQTLERLQRVGCAVNEIKIKNSEQIMPIYLHIVLAEAAAYHAMTLESCPDDYTQAVRLRLEMGRYVLAKDYVRAQESRILLREEVDSALKTHDALVLPTLPIPPPPLGTNSVKIEETEHLVKNVTLRLTQLFNLTGHPAISIPCENIADGLPCGFQLVGSAGRTKELLKLALACETIASN